MSEEKNDITRRRALKVIAVGVGTATALPVLGQEHAHHGQAAKPAAAKTAAAPAKLKFFNAQQMALITTISDLIIPTDDHSPGAKAAEVPAFIDLMVSESPEETKVLWRDGLAGIDKMSTEKFSGNFSAAKPEQQVALLTEISKDERNPKTVEEKFFRAIKNLTIDGYYTSEIGIHKDLQYKGNTYVKEFKGCTHPEHQT
ncbi:MAG: gluconate 2-dehydrogenase subunit 3 family protein [Pyrinomonadaceae bacterium]